MLINGKSRDQTLVFAPGFRQGGCWMWQARASWRGVRGSPRLDQCCCQAWRCHSQLRWLAQGPGRCCWLSCAGRRLPKPLAARVVLVQEHAREEAWDMVMRQECQ